MALRLYFHSFFFCSLIFWLAFSSLLRHIYIHCKAAPPSRILPATYRLAVGMMQRILSRRQLPAAQYAAIFAIIFFRDIYFSIFSPSVYQVMLRRAIMLKSCRKKHKHFFDNILFDVSLSRHYLWYNRWLFRHIYAEDTILLLSNITRRYLYLPLHFWYLLMPFWFRPSIYRPWLLFSLTYFDIVCCRAPTMPPPRYAALFLFHYFRWLLRICATL